MALIGNESRNATVRAVTPGRVAILGKQNFLTMLKLMPHTQEDIMKTVNERAMRKAKK
jgi:CRP-like cAMP-binding protein